MTGGFVAVARTGATADRPALLAAGATAVLSWAELATSTEPDDVRAVLIELDKSADAAERGRHTAALSAVLSMLTSVEPSGGSARAERDVVIATVRPVVDTLKLVDGNGVLSGTAERDDHRFVDTPIAARLGAFRAVCPDLNPPGNAPGPSAVAVLAALVARGATVFASSH